MTPEILSTITRIRGLMPTGGLHVGGSWALYKFFYNNPFIEPNDLDLFFYGPRFIESWAFKLSLEAVGFRILLAGKNYDGKYKIPGQYAFYKLEDLETKVIFDLILIEEGGEASSLGSTFAGIQYQVNYSEEVLVPPKATAFQECWANLRSPTPTVYYNKELNTEEQLEKVIRRANLLGFNLQKTTEKPVLAL